MTDVETKKPRTKGRAAPAKASAEPQIELTTAGAWKKRSEPERKMLPSGPIVLVKRASVVALALTHLPNPLIESVLEHYANTSADDVAAQMLLEPVERLKQNAKAYVDVARITLVKPTLVVDRAPDYDADEIGPGDLMSEDYAFLYEYASGLTPDAGASLDTLIASIEAASRESAAS